MMQTHKKFSTSQSAFSLIEIALVIIVISLLVGFTMLGQNLIDSSKLNRIHIDASKYIKITNEFSEAYGSLPGDMANAMTIWGEAATDNTCIDVDSSNSILTCNGDGDGTIPSSGATSSLNVSSGAIETAELFRFWQHLANAELLEMSFTGIAGTGSTTDSHAVPGTNVPEGVFKNTGYAMFFVASAETGIFEPENKDYNHVLNFGTQTAGGAPMEAAITAEEAWKIDEKIDDGMPFTGTLRTVTDAVLSNDCVTADADNGEYNHNDPLGEKECSLIFITGF